MSVNESNRITWIVAFLSLATWWITLTFGFVWDDFPTVVSNPSLHEWSTLWRGFTTDFWGLHAVPQVSGYWRPLPTVLYVVLTKVFGGVAWPFHAMNLSLHVGISILAVKLLERLRLQGTALLMGALFFALHPLHAETISFISALPDLLAAFCGLMALVWVARNPWPSLVWLGLALLAKESALVFVILWAWSMFSWQNSKKRWVWGVALATLTGLYIGFHWEVTHGIQARGLWGGVWDRHVGTMLMLLPYVLWISVFPWGTSPVRPFPLAEGWTDLRVWGAVATVLVIVVWAWRAYRRGKREYAMSLFLFFLFWAPSSNLIPSEGLLADRYLYMVTLGGALCFGVFAQKVINRLQRPRWALGIFLAWVFMWGSWAVMASLPWRSENHLWQRAVTVAPQSSMAWNQWGSVQLQDENWGEAKRAFAEVLRLDPQNQDGAFNMVLLASKGSDLEEARQRCRAYVDRFPQDAKGWDLYGVILAQMGELDMAIDAGREALTRFPQNWKMAFNLGTSLLDAKRYAQAAEVLEVAKRGAPQELRVWRNLGAAYYFGAFWSQAEATYREILKRWPEDAAAKDQLDRILRVRALSS